MSSPLQLGAKGTDARNSNHLANGNTNLFNISRQKINSSEQETRDYNGSGAPQMFFEGEDLKKGVAIAERILSSTKKKTMSSGSAETSPELGEQNEVIYLDEDILVSIIKF